MSDFHLTRDEAVKALRAAIEDEGPRPDLHRKTMRKHRNEWPTLWKAIDALLAGADAESPCPAERKWRLLQSMLRAGGDDNHKGTLDRILRLMDAMEKEQGERKPEA